MDDNNSKTLDFNEFQKALNDYRVNIPPDEYQRVFGLFDRDRNGEVNYDEFLRAIVVSFFSSSNLSGRHEHEAQEHRNVGI